MSCRSRVAVVVLALSLRATFGASQQAALPEITSESDTGWHDLVFRIQSAGSVSDGSQLLRVAGTYHGTPVSLDVFLAPTWKEGQLASNVPLVTYRGMVGLRSLGVQSDRLLVVIDELYGTAQHPRRMRPQTDFTGISLEGDPRHLKAGATKIKLFFESEDEKRYAELYLNIDLRAAKLELAEKDPDYRAPIVRALSAP